MNGLIVKELGGLFIISEIVVKLVDELLYFVLS